MKTEQEILDKKREWERELAVMQENHVASGKLKPLKQRIWTLNWVTEFEHTSEGDD